MSDLGDEDGGQEHQTQELLLLNNDEDEHEQDDEDNAFPAGEYNNDTAGDASLFGTQQSSLFDIPSAYGASGGSIGSDENVVEDFPSTLGDGNQDLHDTRDPLPPSPDLDNDHTTPTTPSVTCLLTGTQFTTHPAPPGVAATRLHELQQHLGILNQIPTFTPHWLTNISAGANQQPPFAPGGFVGGGAMVPGQPIMDGPPHNSSVTNVPLQQSPPLPQTTAGLSGASQSAPSNMFQQSLPQQQQVPAIFLQQPAATNNLIPHAMVPLLHPIARLAGSATFPYGVAGSNCANGPKPAAMGNNPLFVPLMAANAISSSTRSLLPTLTPQSFARAQPSTSTHNHLPPLFPQATFPNNRAALKIKGKGATIGTGSIEPFPEKLHRLLREVELTGRVDVISFVDKDTFRIHDSEIFFRDIVPSYFRHSRLSSFKRQLNLYGFVLVTKGIGQGGYRHELFRKDEPALCRQIRRVAIKHPQQQQQQRRPMDSPPSISEETLGVSSNTPPPDDGDDDTENVNSLKGDLDEHDDDETDLNDDSIGSSMILTMPGNDHENDALHDPSALDGLYFGSSPL